MVKRIEHSEAEQILRAAYRSGVSTILLGRTGIGKSNVIKETAKKLAAEQKKEFAEWNELTLEQKYETIANPGRYFGFLDIRLTQYEPSDIKGLPWEENGSIIWKKNLWVKAFQKMAGVILFDEINLSPPMLQNSVYQIILDKQVGDAPLSDKVMIVGAGNMTEDKANTFEIPKPVISRSMVYELQTPSGDKWVDWALNHGIDNRVIGYIKFANHKLFFEKDDMLNIITPRGWEFVSNLITGTDNLDTIELLSSGILGEGGAFEFVGFIKLTNKWDIDKILKKPKTAEIPTEIDQLYSLVSAIATKYHNDNKLLKPILQLTERMKPDFAILMLRFVKRDNPQYFISEAVKLKEWDKISELYSKYLM